MNRLPMWNGKTFLALLGALIIGASGVFALGTGLYRVEATGDHYWIDSGGMAHYVEQPDVVVSKWFADDPVLTITRTDIEPLTFGETITIERGPELFVSARPGLRETTVVKRTERPGLLSREETTVIERKAAALPPPAPVVLESKEPKIVLEYGSPGERKRLEIEGVDALQDIRSMEDLEDLEDVVEDMED